MADTNHTFNQCRYLPDDLKLGLLLTVELFDNLHEPGVGAHRPLESLVHGGLELRVVKTEVTQLVLEN